MANEGPHIESQAGKKLSPEEQNVQTFLYYVRSGKVDIDFALNLKTQWRIPDSFLRSPDAQAAAVQGVLLNLKAGNAFEVRKIRDIFELPADVLHTAEMESLAREGFMQALRTERLAQARVVAEIFALPVEAAESIVVTAIEEAFLGLNSSLAEDIAVEFKVAPEKMTEKTHCAALEQFNDDIGSQQFELALYTKEVFGLSDEEAPMPR